LLLNPEICGRSDFSRPGMMHECAPENHRERQPVFQNFFRSKMRQEAHAPA
jgi:hypothetical protein